MYLKGDYVLSKLGFLTILGWLGFFIPGIIGYLNGHSYEYIRKNYFGTIGPLAEPILMVTVFSLSFFLYLKTIKMHYRTSSFKVLGWVSLLTLLLTFLPPFTCEDVYFYIATGQMQSVYHTNPYIHNAHEIIGWRSDPFLSTTGWGFLLNMYGPLWTKLTQWLVLISNNNLWLAVWLFKVLAGLLHIFNTILIGVIAKRLQLNISQTMLVYGWNPLLLFELPGHAHNDALLITFIILAIIALTHGKEVLTLPFLMLSTLVKYTPILLIPLFSLCFIVKKRYQALFLSITIALLIVPISWQSYWQGFKSLKGILRQFDFYSIKSLHYIVFYTIHKLLPQLPRNLIFQYTAKLFTLIFFLVFLAMIIYLLQNKRFNFNTFIFSCLSILILFLLIANKWYQPWYISWLIPWVAIQEFQNSIVIIVLLLSYTAELSRIPQVILNNSGIMVQLSSFLIAWGPIIFLCGRTFLMFVRNRHKI